VPKTKHSNAPSALVLFDNVKSAMIVIVINICQKKERLRNVFDLFSYTSMGDLGSSHCTGLLACPCIFFCTMQSANSLLNNKEKIFCKA
jgi:hypothetical protein